MEQQKDCRFWKCEKDGVTTSSLHVLEECPEFLQLRNDTNKKLWWAARTDLNIKTIVGEYGNITKNQLVKAEERGNSIEIH